VKTLLIKILIVASGHVAVVLLLARVLARKEAAPVDLSFIVFGLPTLAALGLYTYTLRPYVFTELPSAPTTLASVSLGLIPTIISLAISLYIFVNLYGS
jgi:hypothetical protein